MPQDFFSKQGASQLAETITQWWADRGHRHVLAEAYPLRGLGAWGVRSNLVGGLPRGRGRPAGPTKRVLVARTS